MLRITDRAKKGNTVYIESELVSDRQEGRNRLGFYLVRIDGHQKPIPVYEHFLYEHMKTPSANVVSRAKGSFGRNLAYLRLRRGLTQKELAAAAGISPETVGNWERGNYLPSLDMLAPIGAILGADMNTLLAYEVPAQ